MAAIIKALIIIPISLALVLLAVANKGPVQISLDPFSTSPVTLPLFGLILACVAAGVVIGGVSTWFVQAKHRRAARETRREARELRSHVETRRAADPLGAPALPARRA